MRNIGNENRAYNPPPRSHDMQTSPSRIHHDVPSCSTTDAMLRRATAKVPHVCVVGAGVAGMRCADVLLRHGVRVTILEGRERVGGRFCQSNVLGHVVDLGPNWIHGTNNNPILDLAKETETLTMNWDGRQAVFDHAGKPLGDAEAAESTEQVWGIIEQAMKYSNEESASIPAEKSLYDYFEEQVVKLFPSGSASDVEVQAKRDRILQMSEMWGAFVGSPIQQQSLKFFWLEECIDGENLFVAGTYSKVLAKIAKSIQAATVKFGHKVEKIVSNEEGEYPSVTVEIEGRESETFDEVVMTAPLGWLKRNTDAFVPALPPRLKEGIAAIGYGHLDKVYITFPTAFWNTSNNSDSPAPSSSHDPTLPNVPATTKPVHQLGASDSPVDPSHYSGFTSFIAPHYASTTNPQRWNQEAVNLAALPSPTAHPTLLFYTYGPTSLHIADLVARNPPSKHHALLTAFFYPYFSRLPNFTSAPECQPTASLATAWANDELAGYGSYANFPAGLARGDEDVEVMRRGVPERGLWLAGEHTAPFVALGTVTGAWWAGEGVAQRIVSAYGLGDGKGEGLEEGLDKVRIE